MASAGLSAAQEVGRVISSTPAYQQVAVPRQVCATEQVAVQGRSSGAGALMGGMAGGALGNAMGGGSGRAVATVLGIFGGAILGDRIEGGGQPQVQNVQNCTTQSFYENRLVGYDVVYDYADKQYAVQMPNDPGPTVQLQITPVSSAPAPSAPAQPVYTQPVYLQPQTAAPVQYGVPAAAYYPPVGISLNLGYSGGHHPRHWR
jgi:uncharacterized protein YcfJ